MIWYCFGTSSLVSVNTAHEIEILKGSSYSQLPLASERLLLLSFFASLSGFCYIVIWLDAIKDHGSVDIEGRNTILYGILFEKTANTRE